MKFFDKMQNFNPFKTDQPGNISYNSGFYLSEESLSNLEGVTQSLVDVTKRAIELTTVDFVVLEGLRTMSEQREYVSQGLSQTMNSRHLSGNAVDVGALVNGSYNGSDLSLYADIAEAFSKASREQGTPIRWGGCWEVLGSLVVSPYAALLAYGDRKRANGETPFFDAGHFEIPR